MASTITHNRSLALIGLSLLSFIIVFDIRNSLLINPFIQAEFHLSILQSHLLLNMHYLIVAASYIFISVLSAKWGYKKFLYSGMSLYLCALIGMYMSSNLHWLLIARGLLSLGSAILFLISAALLLQIFPGEKKSFAISIFMIFTSIGCMAPIFSGFIIHLIHWRFLYIIQIPILVIAFLLCILGLPKKLYRSNLTSIAWVGLFLFIFAIETTIISATLIQQNKFHYLSGLITIAVPLIGWSLFIPHQIWSKNPILSRNFVRHPHFLFICCIFLLVAPFVYLLLFLSPLYFKIIHHANGIGMGLLIGIVAIFQLITSAIYPYFEKKYGLINFILIGVLFTLIVMTGNSFFSNRTSTAILILSYMWIGFIMSIFLTSAISLAHHVHQGSGGQLSIIIGFIYSIWNIGTSLYILISVELFNWFQLRYISNYLHLHQYILSIATKKNLRQTLHDPSILTQILHQSHPQSTNFYNIATAGFLYAYQHTFLILSSLLAIIFVIILYKIQPIRKTSWRQAVPDN